MRSYDATHPQCLTLATTGYRRRSRFVFINDQRPHRGLSSEKIARGGQVGPIGDRIQIQKPVVTAQRRRESKWIGGVGQDLGGFRTSESQVTNRAKPWGSRVSGRQIFPKPEFV